MRKKSISERLGISYLVVEGLKFEGSSCSVKKIASCGINPGSFRCATKYNVIVIITTSLERNRVNIGKFDKRVIHQKMTTV